MTALKTRHPFWNFSLAVYSRPGVAQECLALQDSLNLDVNILMYCAWMGAENKVSLSAQNIIDIEAHVRDWHETVVRPLRALRQAMKKMPEMIEPTVVSLRKKVAANELRAEQLEQASLFAISEKIIQHAHPAFEDCVSSNVMLYLSKCAGNRLIVPPNELIASASLLREEHAVLS